VAVDPGKDLPRYPAVEPKDAISTWQVKKGFKLQLAAHEPQVRDPIAICFDEHGRMFVCEMHDYSEMREVTPHMGRISMLQDKDGDGYYETSQIFADDLPWPTGLVWANGGLYVGPRRTSGALRTRTAMARRRSARKSSPVSARG
jgi:glucose/arabinose dehydrogenase